MLCSCNGYDMTEVGLRRGLEAETVRFAAGEAGALPLPRMVACCVSSVFLAHFPDAVFFCHAGPFLWRVKTVSGAAVGAESCDDLHVAELFALCSMPSSALILPLCPVPSFCVLSVSSFAVEVSVRQMGMAGWS